MRHISAVLMMVLALRSTQWTLTAWLIWVRFVRSDVGEVISKSVALESTFFRRVLAILISDLNARGQSFRLQKFNVSSSHFGKFCKGDAFQVRVTTNHNLFGFLH